MDVAACPRCASLDVRMPTILDGVWPGGGETNFSVCADCHYRGSPLLFADEAEYLVFRHDLPGDVQSRDPAPEHGMAAPPQRTMPAFIMVVGAVAILATLASASASFADPAAVAADRMSAGVMAVVGVLVGIAFLRIAVRARRPRSA